MGSESKQVPEVKNPADASEALNELLERGEISAEAYAEYSATADAALSFSTGSSPHTRQASMFDHITPSRRRPSYREQRLRGGARSA
jgi:hypothetical protein